MRELVASGVEMYYAAIKPKTLIYVPAGFFLYEFVERGVLIYGCRWSLIVRSAAMASLYSEFMGLYSAAGKNTSKMQLALEAISPRSGE